MDKKEKALLDYMYGQAQNLIDYMRRNGFEEKNCWISVKPHVGGYNDAIHCDVFKIEGGKRIALEKRASNFVDAAEYEELVLGDDNENAYGR